LIPADPPTAQDDAALNLTPREQALVNAIAARTNGMVLDNLIEMGLDNLAERVVECLRAPDNLSQDQGGPRLVDARELAAKLHVSRDTIYEHAHELGGERIGSGPRGRLRFDLDRALEAWTSRSGSKESQEPQTPAPASDPVRRRRKRLGSSPELLPIRDTEAPANAGPEGT